MLLRPSRRRVARARRTRARRRPARRGLCRALSRPAVGRRAPARRDRPGADRRARRCCCATRSCRRSTSRCRPAFSSCCAAAAPNTASPCCSSRTTSRWCDARRPCRRAVSRRAHGDRAARADVFAPPFHPYTHSLLEAVPTIAAAASRGARRPPADAGRAGARGAAAPIAGRCPWQLGRDLRRRAPPWRETPDGLRIRCHLPLPELHARAELGHGRRETQHPHRREERIMKITKIECFVLLVPDYRADACSLRAGRSGREDPHRRGPCRHRRDRHQSLGRAAP